MGGATGVTGGVAGIEIVGERCSVESVAGARHHRYMGVSDELPFRVPNCRPGDDVIGQGGVAAPRETQEFYEEG